MNQEEIEAIVYEAPMVFGRDLVENEFNWLRTTLTSLVATADGWGREEVYDKCQEDIKQAYIEGALNNGTKREWYQRGRDSMNDCACGEKWTFGVVHLKDKPCYWPPKEQRIEHCAEPACPECNLAAYNAGAAEMLEKFKLALDYNVDVETKERVIGALDALKGEK